MLFTTTSKDLDWVFLLVHVSLPGDLTMPARTPVVDTEVRLSTQLYMEPSSQRGISTKERWIPLPEFPLWISAQSPMATVQRVNGETYQVSIEQLKTGFNPRAREVRDIYHSGTPLGKGELDDFILTLPELFLNGEKINTAPIHFKKREERYFPILNC